MEEQKPNNVIELNPNKDIKNKGEDEMVLKMINEDEWMTMRLCVRKFSSYEDLCMDALDPASKEVEKDFYLISDVYFNKNTSEFIEFIKNNSRIKRTALMSGSITTSGYLSQELTEDQDPDDLDWSCDYIDDLEDQDNYGFIPDASYADVEEEIEMNNYDTYTSQFIKETEETLR